MTLAVAIGLFFRAITLRFEQKYFPTDIRDQFAVLVRLPETATIEQANEKTRQVEDLIRKRFKLRRTLNETSTTRSSLRRSEDRSRPFMWCREVLLHSKRKLPQVR